MKKNINKLVCNVFFSCFHIIMYQKMHLLDVLFSHFWSQFNLSFFFLFHDNWCHGSHHGTAVCHAVPH